MLGEIDQLDDWTLTLNLKPKPETLNCADQVDALVDHFLRFRGEERVLPVVWHQALLCFVQRCLLLRAV